MKMFLRTVLFALVALLLGVVGLVFTEAGQGWAIRRAIGFADLPPGFGVEFESAKLEFGAVRLREVNVGADGVRVRIPSLELRGDLWSAARGKGITLTKLEARDWTLDLRGVDAEDLRGMLAAAVPSGIRATGDGGALLPSGFELLPSAYAQAASGTTMKPVLRAVFKGIFPHLVLPVDVAIEDVDFGGRVFLPKRFWSPESPVMTVWLGLTGGGLRAGEQGKFKLVSRAEFRDENGRTLGLQRDFDTTFELHADVAAGLEGARQVSDVSLTLNSWIEGGLIPEPLHAGVEVSARRVSGGEDYTVQVCVADKRWVEVTGHYNSAKTVNGSADGVGELVGKWDISLRDVDLPVALFQGGPLQDFAPIPPFELHGEGSFELDALFSDLRAEGRLQSSVYELDERFAEVPSELGDLSVEADFAFQVSGLGGKEGATSKERVERLRFAITPQGATEPLLVIAAAQPFELQSRVDSEGRSRVSGMMAENPELPLFSVDIPGVPLALAEPFMENVGLAGSVLSGRFEATLLSESQFLLKTDGPLRVEHLGLVLEGEPALEELDLKFRLEFEADFEAASLALKLSELEVRDSTDTSLVSANLEADYRMYAEEKADAAGPSCMWSHGSSIAATGEVRADLGQLAKQPILAKDNTVPEAGTFELDFTTSVSELGQSLSALLNVQGLRVQGIALPNLGAQLGAEHDGSGAVTLSLPLTVRSATRQQVSDLKLEGTAQLRDPTQPGDGGTVSAKLHGQKVFLDDLQFLVALASNSDDAEQAPIVPFWQGWEGEASVLLESVSYLGQLELRQVGGRLRLGEGKLRLENISVGARSSTGGFLRGLQDSLTGGLLGGAASRSAGENEKTGSNDVAEKAKTDAVSEKPVSPLDLLGKGLRRLRKR